MLLRGIEITNKQASAEPIKILKVVKVLAMDDLSLFIWKKKKTVWESVTNEITAYKGV